MPKLPDFDPIEYLVGRKYPIANARAAGSMNVSAPGAPSHEEIIRLQQAIDNFRKELSSKTPAEIAALVKAEKKKQHAEIEERRFYNRPGARADFDYYCKMPFWTLDECVALSLGKDPKQVNWTRVQPNRGISAFAREYEKQRELVSRAELCGQLFDPVAPSIFLAWAKEQKFALADELVNCAVNSGLSLKSWQDRFEEQERALGEARSEIDALRQQQQANQANLQANGSDKPLGTKERDSLLKLLIGMAMGGYRYDPHQTRNAATREIQDDIQALGLSMDDGTVLKYLKQGADLIPGEALENLERKPNSAKR